MKTPMQQLIDQTLFLIKVCKVTNAPDKVDAYKNILERATALLPLEREAIEEAVDSVQIVSRRYYKDGTFKDDLLGKEITDPTPTNDGRDYFGLNIKASDYFTQKYGK